MKARNLANSGFKILICWMLCIADLFAIFWVSPSAAAAQPGNIQAEIRTPNSITAERWRIFANMNAVRGDPGVVAYNQKIYVMGGSTAFYPTKSQEVYNPLTNTWQYLADLPAPGGRADLMVAAVGSSLYAIGGWFADGNNPNGFPLGNNDMYDPALNTWTSKSPLPTPVSGAGVVVLNNVVYILGGYDNTNVVGIVQKYDPAGNSWSAGTAMPVGRSEFGAVLANGKIYAVGGVLSGGIVTNTVDVYDPVANSWTAGPPLPENRASMAVAVRLGQIYAIGGTDAWPTGVSKNTAFVLDPNTGIWSTVDPMPTSRWANRAAVVSDIIYTVGGVGNAGVLSANEGFGFQPIPSTTTITSDAPDPSQAGQPFTVSFSVAATGETPTGLVTITVQNNPESCSGSLVGGSGSCQLTLGAPGAYTLTATYAGNHILLGSSDTGPHTVVKADTSTLIDAGNPNPSQVGKPFIVTVTVSSPYGTPTGSVTVTVSSSSATCDISLANGTGNCSLNLPFPGTYTLTAAYGGDANFNPSSGTGIHVVNFRVFLPIATR